ncbi:MAG: hypothetical protein ABL867_04870 [Rickettsiales bacterium]
MIKKFYDYILSISDLYLLAILLVVVLFIYGCSSYKEKNAVDWNGLNYAKCSSDSKNPECNTEDSSAADAIGKGGKR